jgi:hypothetical protein
VTFSLCRDHDSVWGPVDGRDQVNMTGIREPDKLVTYEGLRRSTANMFPPNLFDRIRRIDAELPARLAKRYWRAVSEACPEAWIGDPIAVDIYDEARGAVVSVDVKYRLKDLVGVAALSRLGQDIIRTHMDSGEDNKLETLVYKLSDVNWQKHPKNPWMRSQAGFAGQKDLYSVLYAWVYSDTPPGNV